MNFQHKQCSSPVFFNLIDFSIIFLIFTSLWMNSININKIFNGFFQFNQLISQWFFLCSFSLYRTWDLTFDLHIFHTLCWTFNRNILDLGMSFNLVCMELSMQTIIFFKLFFIFSSFKVIFILNYNKFYGCFSRMFNINPLSTL